MIGLPTDSPEVALQKLMVRSIVGVGAGAERFTTWTVVGVALVVTFGIAHVVELRTIVSDIAIKWSLSWMIVSLLLGVISKNLGQGVINGLQNMARIEQSFSDPDFAKKIEQSKMPPDKVAEWLASIFVWPIPPLLKWSNLKAFGDPLRSDKVLAKLFSWQIITNGLHILFAVIGFFWIVFSL